MLKKKGKPRTLIIGITEDDFSDFILEQSQQHLESLDEAGREYLKKGGVTIEDYLAARKKKTRCRKNYKKLKLKSIKEKGVEECNSSSTPTVVI